MSDTFTKALEGDRDAQLVNIVRTLAMHMRCLLPLPMWTLEVRLSVDELCAAAMDYISAPPPPKPRCDSCCWWLKVGSDYGLCKMSSIDETIAGLPPVEQRLISGQDLRAVSTHQSFGCVQWEKKC